MTPSLFRQILRSNHNPVPVIMKKLILLFVVGLWVMPAFAQQKKKHSTRKRPAVTVVKKKKALPIVSPVEKRDIPGPVEGPQADRVFTSVEELPEFPGGTSALHAYMAAHLRYPREAVEQYIQGKVYLQFVVDTMGNVGEITIMRDIGGGCGAEAKRVVRGMPRWKPGRTNGQPVRTFYSLPVSFKLEDEAPPAPSKEQR